MERETRFELATLALARRCSTTELLPQVARLSIPGLRNQVKLWLEPHLKPASQNRAANPSPRAPAHRRAYTDCGWQSRLPRGCERSSAWFDPVRGLTATACEAPR